MIGEISAAALAGRAAKAMGRGLLQRWYLVAIAILGLLLFLARGDVREAKQALAAEQQARRADAATARAASLADERRFADRQLDAVTSYADRLAAREPIIIRSTDTVRTYAQTDAGRARCLAPDRVRGIDALDRDLARDPGPTAGGADAVRADADAPAG